MATQAKPGSGSPLLGARARIEAQARRDGYVEPGQWQAVADRLTAVGYSHTNLAELRAELSRSAAADHWVFPDEPPPADASRALDLLVQKARAQAGRAPIITEGFLSSLLRLGVHWGLAHEVVAQVIAARCVGEGWSVDWELACGMEGLLAAEQTVERQRTARAQAAAQFERHGQKGWLSADELSKLYAGLRQRGIPEPEARALWDGLHASADARGWAWAGPWSRSEPTEQNLNLLVDKVATQAKAKRRIARGFRHAVLDEAAAAGIEEAILRAAIAERQEGERWPATFDEPWRLAAAQFARWWPRVLERLDRAAVPEPWRNLAESGFRVAPPILGLAAVLNTLNPSAAPPPLVSPEPAAVVAASMPVMAATPQPAPALAPVIVHPMLLLVANTDGEGARLRTAPAIGPVARLLREGTAVVEIGSEQDVDGMGWKQVRAPDGTSGWVAADLLQPENADPAGTG